MCEFLSQNLLVRTSCMVLQTNVHMVLCFSMNNCSVHYTLDFRLAFVDICIIHLILMEKNRLQKFSWLLKFIMQYMDLLDVTPKGCRDLSDMTLTDEDTNSIITQNTNRAVPIMHVAPPGGHLLNLWAIISKTIVTDTVFANRLIPQIRFFCILTLLTCFPSMFEMSTILKLMSVAPCQPREGVFNLWFSFDWMRFQVDFSPWRRVM